MRKSRGIVYRFEMLYVKKEELREKKERKEGKKRAKSSVYLFIYLKLNSLIFGGTLVNHTSKHNGNTLQLFLPQISLLLPFLDLQKKGWFL